jgi:hypothetical protein
MTAAIQHRTTTGPRFGGRRFFASPPCAPRRQKARPEKRVVGRKTAPGIFFAPVPERHLEVATQSLGTHQENSVCYYGIVSGCAVGPNNAGTASVGPAQSVNTPSSGGFLSTVFSALGSMPTPGSLGVAVVAPNDPALQDPTSPATAANDGEMVGAAAVVTVTTGAVAVTSVTGQILIIKGLLLISDWAGTLQNGFQEPDYSTMDPAPPPAFTDPLPDYPPPAGSP